MRVLRVDPRLDVDRAVLREAGELLRTGRLVAFPTETVYGLGANALDPVAVQRIYDAKGRPEVNPVIVHVPDAAAAKNLARDWTAAADLLAKAFWPGPITLVVRKRDVIPDIVTAGRDTVGLRVPSHPVAIALLLEAGVPVAAPSANPSTEVSPTNASHVMHGLGDRVDLIIDGGPTTVGIESTVVDVTGDVPRILRPGMITRDAIARVVGAAEVSATSASADIRSPGMLGKHYAPRARIQLFDSSTRTDVVDRARASAEKTRVGAMVFEALGLEETERRMPPNPQAYAQKLYATLHQLDDERCEVILVERPPNTAEWVAILDRLERAARRD